MAPAVRCTPIEINARVVEIEGQTKILALCRDISMRKRTEEERLRALREVEHILDTVSDIFYMLDNDGRIVLWNSALERITGLTAKELKGAVAVTLLHPDDRAATSQAIEQVFREGSASVESRLLTHDGGSIPHVFSGTVLTDAGGGISGLAGTAKDISDRKLAEEALRVSEEKYRGIFNESIAAIYMFDEQKNFLAANQAGIDLLGYSREELLTMGIPDVDADTEVVLPAHGQLLSGGKIVNYEHRLTCRDGSVIVVLNNSRPLFDAEGNVTGMQSPLIDITERKQADEALQQSERNLGNLFSTMDDLLFIVDLEGTILAVNNQALDKLGYTDEELVGSSMAQVYPRDRAEEAMVRIADMASGNGDLCLVPLMTKSGVQIPVETKLTRGKWGNQEALFGIARDITERLRMEEELLKVRKLDSLGLLAGGIAHDFNNLLTAISGNISLAKMNVKSGDEVHGNLEMAEKASLTAQKLTQQLLTFSKGGAPVRKTAQIGELIIESTRFALSGSNVRCEFEIADNLWPVEVDEGQMSQVINNMIINADQAMPDGGTVTVRATNVTLGAEEGHSLKEGRYLNIAIEDKGTGIAAEHLGTIFDPYFTTKDAGSGLGLASSHSIVSNHDGLITVSSRPGTGTTFHVYPSVALQRQIFDV